MENSNIIAPLKEELPSHYADRLGIAYTSSVSHEHKKVNGQFFTPLAIASFMASYSAFRGSSARILDPGCGSAILSCALVEHLSRSNKDIKSIELVAYETDAALVPVSKQVISYLENWGQDQGLTITTTLHTEDFVLHNADCLKEPGDLFARPIAPFDVVISNPPYFKLSMDDPRTKAARVVVNGHPNIYAIFMATSAKLLKENGELIFITPRSYAAGGYFRAFREYFFNLIDLEKAHLFVSRKDTFGRDQVLQETVIIKGIRKDTASGAHVFVSSSNGLKDLNSSAVKSFPKKDIINVDSSEKILYLPTTDFEESVLEIFKSWAGNLSKYNIKISTGPVVAFRVVY